jgi:hypothetical protein
MTSWGGLIGPVFREDIVPQSVREQPGLIRLVTRSGTVVYPERQFLKIDNRREPVPEMQKAMLLLTAENAVGAGFTNWTQAGYLLGPREELDGHSYSDILTDSGIVSDEKYKALGRLMAGVSRGFAYEGIDPDRIWAFMFQRELPEAASA